MIGAIVLLALQVRPAAAFSVIGPYEAWMTPQNGFRLAGDIGGPMSLGEEFRWNVPVLTYAFDPSFLDYFGSNGVAAVESAFGILNQLPPASQIDPSIFPPEVIQANDQAKSEGLFDLKSQALALLLEQLGLASPTRFAFCLRRFSITNNEIQGLVVQRNFDPITELVSSNVNDTLYFYRLGFDGSRPGTNAQAFPVAVDPSSLTYNAVADGVLSAGEWYAGLSRDDAGGLRYLLRTNNVNFETLLADVHGADTNAAGYTIQALRGGVDKITFVRRDYDSLLGGFFSPFTNRFTDTYVSNNVVFQQQLERVTTRPDIVFRAADLNAASWPAPFVVRTDTSNWLPSPAAGAQSGPGLIQTPVEITFNRLATHLRTSDSLTNGFLSLSEYHWGSFDSSTNLPAVFPAGPTAGDADYLSLYLRFDSGDGRLSRSFTFQLPVALGGIVTLQNSTNLIDWASLTTVTNRGSAINWDHKVTGGIGFLRVVPE